MNLSSISSFNLYLPLFDDIRQQKKAFARNAAYLILMLVFYFAGSHSLALFFNTGLKEYYCLHPSDILIIGHSMSEMGIDKTVLENQTKIQIGKYCINGAGPTERLVMLKHYIETTQTRPKILIYDVGSRIFAANLSSRSHELFYPFINESKACRDFINKHTNTCEKLLLSINPLCRYELTRLGAVQRGFTHDWKCRKTTRFDPMLFQQQVKQGNFWRITFEETEMTAFKETLEFCQSNHIRVILLALPNVDLLNQAEPNKYENAMKLLESFANRMENITFLDYNPGFSSQYDLFADPIHLSPYGQKVMTEQVGQDLLRLQTAGNLF